MGLDQAPLLDYQEINEDMLGSFVMAVEALRGKSILGGFRKKAPGHAAKSAQNDLPEYDYKIRFERSTAIPSRSTFRVRLKSCVRSDAWICFGYLPHRLSGLSLYGLGFYGPKRSATATIAATAGMNNGRLCVGAGKGLRGQKMTLNGAAEPEPIRCSSLRLPDGWPGISCNALLLHEFSCLPSWTIVLRLPPNPDHVLDCSQSVRDDDHCFPRARALMAS
jgi:hypothetical protein